MNVEEFALVTNDEALEGERILRRAFEYVSRHMENAKDVVIVSAFYSESFAERILKTTKSNGNRRTLTLVFAGAPDVARKDQIVGLKHLQEELVKSGLCSARRINIRLAMGTKFLHAKLFRFRSEGRLPVYVLGSANLSNAAFRQNDEVMVAIKGRHPGLDAYIRHVLRNTCSISELKAESAAGSWREFLRNAYLYFRPNRSITYTIDPFAEDEFEAIAERLRQRTIQPLPFSDRNVLGLNLVQLLELEMPENSKLGLRLPTYSIETDYGYWVPMAYVAMVEKKLNKTFGPKLRELEKRGKELRKAGKDYVTGQIKKYIDEVEKRLASGAKRLTLSATQKQRIEDKIIRRVAHLKKLLEDPNTLERFARPLLRAPVPEFWEDQASVDRFFDSFCYDIVSKLSAAKSTPGIVAHLGEKFRIAEDDGISKCRRRIERFFDDGNSWKSNNWPSGL